MEMSLDTSVSPARLSLAGEMTIYAAAELKPALLAPLDDCAALEVDLFGVEEIDSAGLQLLILAKQHATASGKTLSLVRHSRPVQELLDLYRLAPLFGDPVLIAADAAGERS